MYNNKYHTLDLSKHSFLVTGGAGFIGSNIVEYLMKYDAGFVRVLDNLSNGRIKNIEKYINLPNFEFLEGDIREVETCKLALKDIEFVSHQAALGSVPRSIKDPILTNNVNISGFLNMLVASKESKSLRQFVYAASSSTYGDSKHLPKIEGNEGLPLSPYAITKAVNEMYADVFSKIYGLNIIGLRYFNVFGPRQFPDNPYAAVIPIFCDDFLKNKSPIINGDGLTSRDFTFVENAVQANIKSFEKIFNKSEVFNVACGQSYTLNNIIEYLQDISKSIITPIYKAERVGDVKHSLASIEKSKKLLGYDPKVSFTDGLKIVFEWYKNQIK